MLKKILLSTTMISIAGIASAYEPSDIAKNYAAIAHASYEDSLITAKTLKDSLDMLAKDPNENTLQAAREAWIDARVPYQQTEVFRFGNPIVDEWEGRVNAWPLDEGLIDYVADDYGFSDENVYASVNVVSNASLEVSGSEVDASEITPELIESLHELDGIEANVASGYHAIEFLLWGQDLNGTNAGAGARLASDFDVENCTNGNCDRRLDYLLSATDLLITDLEEMVANWAPDGDGYQYVLENDIFNIAFTGMGSLSYGEQAGERMKLGLLVHDPEEEHDCFSDNTHNSHFYDGKGVQNIWLGSYTRVDGSVVEGPSINDYVSERDAELAADLSKDLESTMTALGALVEAAENGMAYDQMLAAGNTEGNALIQAGIDGLIAQTRNIERAAVIAEASDVSIEGSDSLDNPNAVFE